MGNHELWHTPYESLADGSFCTGPTSLTRHLAILQLAHSLGIHVCPTLLGDDLAIVPLQSWYHFGFLHPGAARLANPPPTFELREMDGACKWPAELARRSTDATLAPYFARLNDELGLTPDAVTQRAGARTLVTFSHFLPRPELHRGFGNLGANLADVEGSKPLGEQVGALSSAVHVFGHTHWAIDMYVDGTRYVQYPLGYANERERAPYRVHATEAEPFALVWERGVGVASSAGLSLQAMQTVQSCTTS